MHNVKSLLPLTDLRYHNDFSYNHKIQIGSHDTMRLNRHTYLIGLIIGLNRVSHRNWRSILIPLIMIISFV